jgi:ABC-type Fe3+ transport system substrate-binding protein
MRTRCSMSTLAMVPVVVGVSMLISFTVPRLARAATAEGKRLLQQLIEGARKEGQLDLMVVSSLGEKGSRELISAFKKRFGLEITTHADLSGQESQKFNQAIAETKEGIPPTFDLMQGQALHANDLKNVGGVEPIQNWELLLSEISPEAYKLKDRVSPQVLAGYGFLWATRTLGLLYNPRLISERELPSTRKEMGNPRYAGAFSVPSWTGTMLMGLLKYNNAEWLNIVKSMRANKPQVLTYEAGIQRMMLGDLKFSEGNSFAYFKQKSIDPNAPLELTFFEDYVPIRELVYVIRKGARHVSAAKLFALWATGAEANRIFDRYGYIENLVLGMGPTSRRILRILKERNVKPIGWFDSPQTLEKFHWLETKEGKEYARAIATAQKN